MRILVLSTYPIANPIHGGQHRLSQIASMLERDGHEVHARGILGAEAYPLRSGYLRYPGEAVLSRYIAPPTLMEDWAIGRYAADEDGGFSNLAALCDKHYDIVFCEQPWLFDFAYRRFASAARRPAFVYGSQNIEHVLKREIVEQYLTKTAAERCSVLVEQTERFAATNADLVVAVSEHDVNWLKTVTPASVVLAQNGVVDRRASIDDVRLADELSHNRKFALYCASGHPPNINGFFDIFGAGIGCLAPAQRLVVAGGAGPSIVGDARFPKASGLRNKVLVTGEVGEAQLRGLLATAHVIVLPITHGGGTNLKSAEALWSGRHVVATNVALRGFEKFKDARGLKIANEPASFLAAIRRAMSESALQLTPEERSARAAVLWSSTLSSLSTALHQLSVR